MMVSKKLRNIIINPIIRHSWKIHTASMAVGEENKSRLLNQDTHFLFINVEQKVLLSYTFFCFSVAGNEKRKESKNMTLVTKLFN